MTVLGDAQCSRTPSGMKVAPQSYKSLEAAAADLRSYLPMVPGTQIIDAQQVLERTLPKAGFNYKIAFNSDLRECAAFTIPDYRLVVLRQDIYDGLFTGSVFSRSTVLHELSHIVLRHHVTLHRGAQLGQHRHFEDSEWQAKAMTAAIIMPVNLCKKVSNAQELAEMCGASVQSASYRLNKLRDRRVL